jgi:hypothetical protein
MSRYTLVAAVFCTGAAHLAHHVVRGDATHG